LWKTLCLFFLVISALYTALSTACGFIETSFYYSKQLMALRLLSTARANKQSVDKFFCQRLSNNIMGQKLRLFFLLFQAVETRLIWAGQ